MLQPKIGLDGGESDAIPVRSPEDIKVFLHEILSLSKFFSSGTLGGQLQTVPCTKDVTEHVYTRTAGNTGYFTSNTASGKCGVYPSFTLVPGYLKC